MRVDITGITLRTSLWQRRSPVGILSISARLFSRSSRSSPSLRLPTPELLRVEHQEGRARFRQTAYRTNLTEGCAPGLGLT